MVDSVSDQPALGPEAEQDASEDHIALIYETADEELSTTTQLIRLGLEKGELCLHISNEENDERLVEALKAEHIDVEKAVTNGSLILANKNEIYFKIGRFDPDWTIRVVKNIADLAKDYKFTAMRIISDMSWVLESLPGVERWAEYEAKLNSLSPGISVRTICQYDRRAFPPEALLAAVKAHPKVASHGSVCKNHLYVPADLLLKGGYAGAELDRVLDSIRRSSSREADLKDRRLELEQTKKRLENEATAKKKLEAALEDSRRRFSEFAERTSDWVWEIGRDGTYVYSSPRVRDILGLRPEEVMGRNPLELVAAGEMERVSEALARAAAEHAPITSLEKEVRHKDGHTVFLEMSGTPLFDRDGEFAGYRGTDRDITGRKTAKMAIDEHRKKAEAYEAEAEAKGQKILLLETDSAHLRAAMEERDAALVSLNEALATSQHELLQSREEIERLSTSLAQRVEEIDAARATAEERGTIIAERDGTIAVLQEAAQAKEAELSTVREALAGAQDSVAEKEADIILLRRQAERMESEMGTARETISQKESELAAAKERIEHLVVDIARVQGELEYALSSVESVKAELEARTSELKDAQETISHRDEEISQTYARIGVLDVDLSKASTELSSALATIEITREDLASRTAELGAANEAIGQNDGELAAAKEQTEQLNADLARVQGELAAALSTAESTTAELEARTGELQAAGESVTKKDEELSRAGARISELEADVAKSQSDLSAAVALVEGTKADLATCASELQGSQEAQGSLERERERLVQLVREQGELIASMQGTVTKFSSELNERESLITDLQAAAAFRESELVTRKSVAERHAVEAEERAREPDGLRTELDAAEAELTELRALLAETREANVGKGASIAALSTKLEEMELEIRTAKAAMNTKAAELERDREALDESQGRFRALFDQAGVAVVRTDPEGKLVEANGKFFEMLDRTSEELIGSTYHDYTHRDDVIFIAGMYDRLINGRARSGTLPARFLRKLGTVIQVSMSMSVVRDERGSPKYVMSLIEDRTEQMLAEQALLEKEGEKEKERSAGSPSEPAAAEAKTGLVNGHREMIAHDLNDSLTVILGSVSLAKEYVIPEGRMYNKLKQIESASVAARNLASRLMTSVPAEPAGPDTAAPDLVRGRGKILLMDDDESVLEAIGDLLGYLGYNVDVARDGEEALKLCREARESGHPFDLAILDLAVTSGMGGREAAQAMQADNPRLKLAVSSGFLADPAMADPTSFGFDMAIAKPYSAELLSKKVGDLIAKA